MRITISVLAVLFLSSSFCLAQGEDILDIALKNPRESLVQNSDGTWRKPKYGDYYLEKAVENLKSYKHPWTVKKVLKWYRKSKNDKQKASLLYLLAVSRDVRGAVELGNALEKANSLEIKYSAYSGLQDYFIGYIVSGGSEAQFTFVKDWWDRNKERLQEEANKKGEK